MAQAVSPRLLTAKAGFRSQISLREICGEQCGIGTGFSPVETTPPVLHPHLHACFSYETDRRAKLGDPRKKHSVF